MRTFSHFWLIRLICWHTFLTSVFVVIPACLVLGSWGLMDWAVAQVVSIACLHFGLQAYEVTQTGTFTPKRGPAFVFLVVPMLYLSVYFSFDAPTRDSWSIAIAVLLLQSLYISSRVIRLKFGPASRVTDSSKNNHEKSSQDTAE